MKPEIHIGNQTSCWASPLVPFDYALAQGFDAFEWFPDKKPGLGWDESDLGLELRKEVRERASRLAMRLSVHARWQANPLDPTSYPMLVKDLDLARDLDARLLNIHLCHEAGLEAFVDAITPLLHHTAEVGIQLAIENTPFHTPEIFNDLFARLGRLESVSTTHVGMCLDLGHANLCTATLNDYLGFFDRLDPLVPLIHLHLHENWGDADSHLPLFTGPSARDDAGIRGLMRRLQRRRFSGSIILEQWPQPPSLLNQARDRLRQLLEDIPKPAEACASAGTRRSSSARSGDRRAEPERGAPTQVASPARPTAVAPSIPTARQTRSRQAAPQPRSEAAATGPRAKDFGAALAAGDAHCRSWREKLDLVRGLLADETSPLEIDQLVDVAIYLRLLGTGQISCGEDGRHFRPAHHARISLQIQERLAALPAPGLASVARQIYPWLPSSARVFQRAEPLTRIRDIAHRNDIPSELKHEIKSSLQNKLHRCAGPEDLVTSAALLARITAPGANFSPPFVEQFRIFHEELKEFFNARSLEERLQSLLPAAVPDVASAIRAFLAQKDGADLRRQVAALQDLTSLRQRLLQSAKAKSGESAMELLQADIALEDFAFVLVSKILNLLDPGASSGEEMSPPQSLLEALQLTTTNLALSGIAPEECAAIQSELRTRAADTLTASSPRPSPPKEERGMSLRAVTSRTRNETSVAEVLAPVCRDHLLRLKATVERARRLAEDYSDTILSLFPRRVELLGRALGIAEHAGRVFSEAEIRSHLIFQLSKLTSLFLRQLRRQLGLPPWDVMVAGQTIGRLEVRETLGLAPRATSEPAIVLLKQAEGDEEISEGIAAILLDREIPHLSHLGVRARQAGVIFVGCAEPAACKALEAFQGQRIVLTATSEKVAWRSAADADVASGRIRGASALRIPEAQLAFERPWLTLPQVTAANAGGKADGARRLAELAQRPQADFKTPPSLAIPFGVAASALRLAPDILSEYQRLLDQLGPPESLDSIASRLRDCVARLSIPEELASILQRTFPPPARLMVRSSANCEDIEQLAGAGLYESVANVEPGDVAGAIRAVWASLWTRRAILSRNQAGIPHQNAHMGVLIQQMVEPVYSFILHSVNPINQNPNEVYAELALGLGETLAAASVRGAPYRLVYDTRSGSVTMLAFANFSHALRPGPAGGLVRQIVDYSSIELSRDATARQTLGRRLGQLARLVEREFGAPQDIEGAVVGREIYLVQSRAQQGLAAGPTA